MASNETMAEMIPMRERDRIRAVKIRMARKSQNTTDTSSVRETNLRKTAASPEKPFNKSCAQRKARTMANGRIISKKPAK